MSKKLRQVTDGIHGTIYLSELESELISTPYFYRLHDIYQSSTVYMTFPNNRTKRYEHSLGTMELASRMLFSSVANAANDTRDLLFEKLMTIFEDISKAVQKGEKCEQLYFNKAQGTIDNFFDEIREQSGVDLIIHMKNVIKSCDFLDTALDFYQYYPTKCTGDHNTNKNNAEYVFLYRCLLQAIRIVGLFHDVGHPPYSHIIEKVLEELYETLDKDCNIKWNKTKTERFRQCLQPYFSKKQKNAFKCERLLCKSSLIESQPHERIGLGLLSYAIDYVIPQKILNIIESDYENDEKLAHVLYYITVVEFAFAILTEKDIFFKSFHKIVDGSIDADRLDYIVRDSKNSGVDWGDIPYDRIINSSKLFSLKVDNNGNEIEKDNRPFVIAYPKKITDDIEDLLLVRYKIFARINFHHRCMKTSMALQTAVKELAIDYLTHDDECINTDINILWTALDKTLGNKQMRVIQWNDSWLISTLHKALVSLHTNKKTINTRLKDNLQEILLNKKKHYSLIKHGIDNCDFTNKVFEKAKITEADINKLKIKEFEKFYTSVETTNQKKKLLSDPKNDALDSIGRISEIFETLDLESLCMLIPLSGDELEKIIQDELEKRQDLTGATAIINYGRKKNGLPKHKNILDGIYLYKDDVCVLYDEHYSLSNQIQAITKNIPWLYVYFVPAPTVTNVRELNNDLIDQLSGIVGEKLRIRFDELFNGSPKME